MSLKYNPAPTYADYAIRDENGNFLNTNPIWLKWYLDLAALLNGLSVGSSALSIDDASGILSQRSFVIGPNPVILTSNAQPILENQIFGA